MTVGTHVHTFRFNSETDVRRPLTEMTRYILPLTGYSASKSNHYFFSLIMIFLRLYTLTILQEHMQGRIQDFKLGGAHLQKLRRAEGGAKILGVFRVINHDFTPKNHIVSNCRGRREIFWGISFEKSRFYAKKSYFFQFQGRAPPPLNPPLT